MEWKVQSLNGDPVIVQKDNTPVAFMAWGQPLSKAQLISAAPDLYEALDHIVWRLDRGLALGEKLELTPARKALNKARGG